MGEEFKTNGGERGDSFNGCGSSEVKYKNDPFPDPAFPLSMSYIEFMQKYKLSVEEFFLLREKVKRGKFVVE